MVKNLFLQMSGNDITFWVLIGGMAVVCVLLLVMKSRQRQKQQGEYAGMLDNLRAGVRVKTVGGVIGRIIEIREEVAGFKTVLLETGYEKGKSYVLYDIQAIYGVVDDEAMAKAKLAELEKQKIGEQKGDIAQSESTDNGVNKTQDGFEAKKSKGK
jgi:preprotein translocase subunit YajC